jgi:hypothetical protein
MNKNTFNGWALLLFPFIYFIGIFVCIYEEIDWFFYKLKTESKMIKKRRSYKGTNNPNYKTGLFSDNKKRCLDCNKEIGYKSKRCKSCARKGKNHPLWKNGIKSKIFCCQDCNKKLGKNAYYSKTKRCMKCAFTGKLHPNYIDGRSFEKYPIEFNKQLKEIILYRDNYTCQKCGIIKKEHFKKYYRNLEVHHIDYDKKNCNKNNLITLCLKCNIKVNFNRKYWIKFFKGLIKNV